MKKIFKSLICLMLSLTLLGTHLVGPIVYAADITTNQQIYTNNLFNDQYYHKLAKVLSFYSFKEQETDLKLEFNLTKNELISNYGFSSNEADRLLRSVEYAPELLKQDHQYNGERLHFNNGIIYFNAGDVKQMLNWAASIGPAAMYGVLVGISSSFGPIGAIISSALGVIGWPSLATFCYIVTQAVVNNQGVYLGGNFNGKFFNIHFGYW